jgi:hypothetical protein
MRTERKPPLKRSLGAKTFTTRDKETTASRMTFQSPNEYRWSAGSTGISSTEAGILWSTSLAQVFVLNNA